MKRFLTICCSLALVGPTSTVLGATPGTTTNQALLAKRGLSEFDLDGNGTLDASERATALAARNAARHPGSVLATGAVGIRNSVSSSLSTPSYEDTARARNGGTIFVVNPPPSQCPIQNALRNYLNSPHPISGGSVATPVNVVYPSTSGGNGSAIYTVGNDPSIVTASNLPRPAVISWPQLPNSNSGANVYWAPNANLNQQPLATGAAAGSCHSPWSLTTGSGSAR